MASLKIGDQEIALDAQVDPARVEALAGVTPAELSRMLGAPAMVVIAILAVCTDRALLAADLGALMAGQDTAELAHQLRPLFAPDEPAGG